MRVNVRPNTCGASGCSAALYMRSRPDHVQRRHAERGHRQSHLVAQAVNADFLLAAPVQEEKAVAVLQDEKAQRTGRNGSANRMRPTRSLAIRPAAFAKQLAQAQADPIGTAR